MRNKADMCPLDGVGAEGGGDSDDHADGGAGEDQVRPVLARARG